MCVGLQHEYLANAGMAAFANEYGQLALQPSTIVKPSILVSKVLELLKKEPGHTWFLDTPLPPATIVLRCLHIVKRLLGWATTKRTVCFPASCLMWQLDGAPHSHRNAPLALQEKLFAPYVDKLMDNVAINNTLYPVPTTLDAFVGTARLIVRNALNFELSSNDDWISLEKLWKNEVRASNSHPSSLLCVNAFSDLSATVVPSPPRKKRLAGCSAVS